MKQFKKYSAFILSSIAVICLIAAAGIYLSNLKENEAAKEAIVDFQQSPVNTNTPVPIVTEPLPSTSPVPPENLTPTAEPTSTPVPAVEYPYKDAHLSNPDTAGWLIVPGTVIDYPIMWTPKDENYYLYRGFDKKDNKNGCLILDTESSLNPITTNLIIHGHNMKSGAMFGNLTDYEKKSYYEDHKEIILYTPECRRKYEVIAVFRSQVFKKTDDVFKFYKFFQADTEEEFKDFYDNIKDLSLYDTGVTAEFGDRFITLSTCVYHVTNGRFVVIAKEVGCDEHYLPFDTTQN